jgi:hypothetical protein
MGSAGIVVGNDAGWPGIAGRAELDLEVVVLDSPLGA